MDEIKAVLFDLDGTLYIDGVWLEGAVNTLRWLEKACIPFQFVTNTSTMARHHVQQIFHDSGLKYPADQFTTPTSIACEWFKTKNPVNGVIPLIREKTKEDLKDIKLTWNENADFIIMGEMGEEFSLEKMNMALRAMLNGAQLVTLHRNRYFMGSDGMQLGPGPFVAALEYATCRKCIKVFGKPEKSFFHTAVLATKVVPQNTLMVGDDLESDVLGAKEAGLQSVLVQTGKYLNENRKFCEKNQIPFIPSVADLPNFLKYSR